MVVSMIQFIMEFPEVTTIKDKRRMVKSLNDRVFRKFRCSVAEVDLQQSLAFAQIGAAYVSNSVRFGESVMQKVLTFLEDEAPGRIHDISIHSEQF